MKFNEYHRVAFRPEDNQYPKMLFRPSWRKEPEPQVCDYDDSSLYNKALGEWCWGDFNRTLVAENADEESAW